MKYDEDVMKAGVLVESEGLNPNEKTVQIGVARGIRTVLDGPFAETKIDRRLLSDGREVQSRSDRMGLAIPNRSGARGLGIRQRTEPSDLPPQFQELIRTTKNNRAIAPVKTSEVTKTSEVC